MNQRPILVTGATGQLGSAVVAASGRLAVRPVARPDFDFARPNSIATVLKQVQPWLVVNAAAYTAVDKAETEPEAAFLANRDGPAELARVCAAGEIPLIHISTDYVFDGAKGSPYVETDPTAPQCVYGASKLAGEEAVLMSCPHATVLRTAWLYAPGGRNFVRTMLALGRTRDRLTVVADQKGCPTTAADLAAVIVAIATRIAKAGWSEEFQGVFHAVGSNWTTWYGLASAIFEEAASHGTPTPCVDPITTADWPTPAKRPADSRLDCAKLARVFGLRLPEWRESLARTIGEIFAADGH